jgi:hypothetical protein
MFLTKGTVVTGVVIAVVAGGVVLVVALAGGAVAAVFLAGGFVVCA